MSQFLSFVVETIGEALFEDWHSEMTPGTTAFSKDIGEACVSSLFTAVTVETSKTCLSVLLLGKIDDIKRQIASTLRRHDKLKRLYRITGYDGNVPENLPVECIDAEDVAGLLQGRIDVVMVTGITVAANGDAMVDKGSLMHVATARLFDVPVFVLIASSDCQFSVKSGKDFDADSCSKFDLVTAPLLNGFLTDNGLLCSNNENCDLQAFLQNGFGAAPMSIRFSNKAPFTTHLVIQYLKTYPHLAEKIGPNATRWTAREVGDGNINYVYIVEGPSGGLAVKQALPYIRAVGESWPLTTDRLRIEAKWLMEMHEICPEYAPETYAFDKKLSVLVLQYLAPPYETLRSGILAGRIFPLLGQHISSFLARSLFYTSAFALKTDVYRRKITDFCNPELNLATEQVIFMDAYYDAPTNFYLKPELDDIAREVREDVKAKKAISRLRQLYLSNPQALLHGDFHTGSVMVTAERTMVFDSEFAFYGPMGFDIGKFIGNLLLTYFALDGHISASLPRDQQQNWILKTAITVWEEFRKKFLELWTIYRGQGGAYPSELLDCPTEALPTLENDFMKGLFRDVLGFAAACMIRRIITIAQIADYIRIEDRAVRAACSKRALRLARQLLVDENGTDFPDIQSVIDNAKKLREA